MVFKTVDGSLTNIFKKTEQISSGFNLASNEVQSFVDNFNDINSNQKFDRPWERFLQGATNRDSNVALYFAELAERVLLRKQALRVFMPQSLTVILKVLPM